MDSDRVRHPRRVEIDGQFFWVLSAVVLTDAEALNAVRLAARVGLIQPAPRGTTREVDATLLGDLGGFV